MIARGIGSGKFVLGTLSPEHIETTNQENYIHVYVSTSAHGTHRIAHDEENNSVNVTQI